MRTSRRRTEMQAAIFGLNRLRQMQAELSESIEQSLQRLERSAQLLEAPVHRLPWPTGDKPDPAG